MFRTIIDIIMENNASQMLIKEHKIIKGVEELIYAMDLLWEKDSEKYRTNVLKLLHFFKEYSDRFHHYKEEKVLFPEMRNHPDFLLNDIIDELEEHHRMFREYTQEIRVLIEDAQYVKVQGLLKIYINDLLDHIAVEDDELFSMAENLFSVTQYENIFYRFKDIDRELGEKLKEELEKLPQDMLRKI